MRLLPLVGLLGEGLVVRGGRLPLGVGGVLALLLELGLVLPLCRLVLPRLLVPVGRGGARGLCVNRRGLVGGQLRGGPVRGQLLGVLRIFRPGGTGQDRLGLGGVGTVGLGEILVSSLAGREPTPGWLPSAAWLGSAGR